MRPAGPAVWNSAKWISLAAREMPSAREGEPFRSEVMRASRLAFAMYGIRPGPDQREIPASARGAARSTLRASPDCGRAAQM